MSPSVSTAPTLRTAKELLARLVAFDTTSSKTNIPLIAFVEAYLADHGIESRRVPTPDGQKASLFATIGPGEAAASCCRAIPTWCRWRARPGTPTVPARRARRQALRPRHLRHEGLSRLLSRHGADLKARGLKVPFHIAFSYDEEVGCTGVRPMIGEFGKTLADAAHGVRRRAQQHDGGRRAQGPGALARGAHRTGGALEHAALRRQRHRLRRPG